MNDQLPIERLRQIRHRCEFLYGAHAAKACVRRIELIINRYEDRRCRLDMPIPKPQRWDQTDSVLIAYGDSIRPESGAPMSALSRFCQERLKDAIRTVHLLPFFPYSSDDGFSVIDYRKVNPEVGTWNHVRSIGSHFRLMFDLVLNHCSRHSAWFRDFMAGVAPYRDYFVTADPEEDLSDVTRPRPWPLLHEVKTTEGLRHVWTTFSDDQIDLNFANPDVLIEFIDILLFYVAHGAHIIRLDAIAYLWKQVGTPCVHLEQTHEVVRLMRDVLELVAPRAILLTETNVPHDQNISYFGNSDEAHMVYNFSLPPLLMHALQTGNGRYLNAWASRLDPPAEGCTFLNFTASHDGVGVRPLEGILPETELEAMVQRVKDRGGRVNMRTHPDGSQSAYELNITYYDALATGDDALDVDRFCCSQAVAMMLQGMPALYIHSLLGTRNDQEGVARLGHNRAINRHQWDEKELVALLEDPQSTHAKILSRLCGMLSLRKSLPAFHPDGPQQVIGLADEVFAVCRTSPDGAQVIYGLANLSDRSMAVDLSGRTQEILVDLLDQNASFDASHIDLPPYACRWLCVRGTSVA